MQTSLSQSPHRWSEHPRAIAHRLTDPCGKFLPALVYHDLSDRLRGRSLRANARWGAIDRPNHPGKLIWIVAGASRDSVRLGVEIGRAILARRLDVSVMLTFEQEHPDLLGSLGASPRVAWGYAPADYAVSMHSVWRRLLPFAVVLAGVAPRRNLMRLCEACRHAVLVAPPESMSGRFERIYPAHGTTHEGANIAPAADLDVLMLPGRTGSDVGRITDASAGRGLFLWRGSDVAAAKRLFALFRGHLPDDIMLVSGPACRALANYPADTVALSTWAGSPIAPNRLVLADDPAWVRIVAADAWAAHFELADHDALWQALAAGAYVSAIEPAMPAAPSARAAIHHIEDENAMIHTWSQISREPRFRQTLAEESRRAYEAERDLAFRTVSELLDRACAWR